MSQPMEIRHVPDYSVVRLSDGQVGVKGRRSRRALVLFGADLNSGLETPLSTLVEVVAYPAATAAAYMRALDG